MRCEDVQEFYVGKDLNRGYRGVVQDTSQLSPGETGNTRNSVTIADKSAEIRTGYSLNTSLGA
jgi:hypothetical protein